MSQPVFLRLLIMALVGGRRGLRRGGQSGCRRRRGLGSRGGRSRRCGGGTRRWSIRGDRRGKRVRFTETGARSTSRQRHSCSQIREHQVRCRCVSYISYVDVEVREVTERTYGVVQCRFGALEIHDGGGSRGGRHGRKGLVGGVISQTVGLWGQWVSGGARSKGRRRGRSGEVRSILNFRRLAMSSS